MIQGAASPTTKSCGPRDPGTMNRDSAHRLGSRFKTALLRWRMRHLSKRAWRRRHRRVFELHPGYRRPAPAGVEREHLRLWRQLRPDVSVDTLRICYNISGRAEPLTVPEEVYASEIEASLNRHDHVSLLENKNFYNRWFRDGLFPDVYFHNIEGGFYDADYRPLKKRDVSRLLEKIEYPAVMKPGTGLGGRDVHFPQNRAALEALMAGRRNFVVQRKVESHPFFRRFHDHGLNTIRVCVYRDVARDELHVLNAALRMGRGGSLDNLTDGGIVRFIREDGTLNDYALDKYGGRFSRHPDTAVDFSRTEPVPDFEELKRLAESLARHLYLARLVSFDFCMDEAGRWRPIEINIENQTIRFAQYAGRPFFGSFTESVLDYCKNNPRWPLR